jgi:hypothetical protein
LAPSGRRGEHSTAYTVGENTAAKQPTRTHAPIVHVYARRSPAELEKICAVIEAVLVEELELIPGNVFITVQPVYAPAP